VLRLSLEIPWQKQLKSKHRRQEDRLQQTHPASGRLWRWKRDGRFFDFLIEARTTDKGSYTIKHEEWLALRRNSHQTPPGCMPAMDIEIKDISLIVVERDVFEEMFNDLVAMTAALGREQ
jgi:dipeptidyl aminopeptidase/acylaminoacyl peptidase